MFSFTPQVRKRLVTSKKGLLRPGHICFFHYPNIPSQIRCIPSRSITTHNQKSSSAAENEDDGDDEGGEDGEERSQTSQAAFQTWLASQGRRFKYPNLTGPKWLGGSVPFPLNPTFKPPPPLSDRVKDAIYTAYVSNPVNNDLRSLSVRYGISVPRVEAVLKLKALETRWKDPQSSTTLQTGFQQGMEKLLGMNDIGRSLAEELNSPVRDAVKDADEAAVAASIEAQKQTGRMHLSRTYFEPVDEAQLPIVPTLIEEARAKTKLKHNTPSSINPTPEYPSHVVQHNPNRPAFRFVDVGLKWFDPVDAAKRRKESQRRMRMSKRSIKEG